MAAPVTLAMAKMQCQIHALDTSYDELLPLYINAAIDWVEGHTGQALERRAITESFTAFGCYLELSKRPVVSVDEIGYIDADGAPQTVDGALTRVPLGIYPTRVYAASSWPTARENDAITVTYTAGYADDAAPAGLVMACLLLIGHWFANREAVVIGDVSNEVQFAVDALCQQKRAMFT